jgi:hypothetical protein
MIAIAVGACSQTTNEGAKKNASPKPNPDVAMVLNPLPKAPAQAVIELKRRLDRSLEMTDGFLTVYDLGTDKLNRHVLPTTSSWSINCGFGFSIVFGSAISGDRDSVGNDVKLNLAMAGVIPKETCDIAGLAIARDLRERLAETKRKE